MAAQAKQTNRSIAANRKARHDYFVIEAMEAGIELVGTEVKSLRMGQVNLKDSWVEIEDGELLIRRIIKASGRSSYTVNGSPITRIEGRELGELLVDVSSQHAQQSLMRPNVMRELLDEASGNSLCAYHKLYQEMLEAEEKVREIEEMIQKGSEQADYMRFALSELEGAGLREGEEEEL